MQIMNIRFSGRRDWEYDIDGNKVSLDSKGQRISPFTPDGDFKTCDRKGRQVDLPYSLDGDYLGRPPAGGREGSSDWRVNRMDNTDTDFDD